MTHARPPGRWTATASVATWRRQAVAAAVLVLAGGVWVLRTFDPNAAGSLFPPCLFYSFSGLFCPGCGLTRALHALVHFDVARAMAMNPLLVASLPVLALMTLHGLRAPALLPAPVAGVLFNGRYWIAALVLFGVLRNLPWWPFAWLAPG